ncbi:MAG: DUF1080 domain-containing protein [Verrucomicrobiota bacterium]
MKHALSILLVALGCIACAEPESSWQPLFADDLSNADFPEGVWTQQDGILTASQDKNIWTRADYGNFVLDLEFKTREGSNSGVLILCSDVKRWVPNTIEIQITDDHSPRWANADPATQCGAIFGHKAPTRSMVRKPGEWNRFTITSAGTRLTVVLNGETVLDLDRKDWKEVGQGPNGEVIQKKFDKPLSQFTDSGKIGFQGKHGGVPIYFRNIRIRPVTD